MLFSTHHYHISKKKYWNHEFNELIMNWRVPQQNITANGSRCSPFCPSFCNRRMYKDRIGSDGIRWERAERRELFIDLRTLAVMSATAIRLITSATLVTCAARASSTRFRQPFPLNPMEIESNWHEHEQGVSSEGG